jgi:hypothetical protein
MHYLSRTSQHSDQRRSLLWPLAVQLTGRQLRVEEVVDHPTVHVLTDEGGALHRRGPFDLSQVECAQPYRQFKSATIEIYQHRDLHSFWLSQEPQQMLIRCPNCEKMGVVNLHLIYLGISRALASDRPEKDSLFTCISNPASHRTVPKVQTTHPTG